MVATHCSAFAVRFSRSAILFIGEFFGDDLASYPNILGPTSDGDSQSLDPHSLSEFKRTLCTVLYFCVGIFQMQIAKVTVYGS